MASCRLIIILTILCHYFLLFWCEQSACTQTLFFLFLLSFLPLTFLRPNLRAPKEPEQSRGTQPEDDFKDTAKWLWDYKGVSSRWLWDYWEILCNEWRMNEINVIWLVKIKDCSFDCNIAYCQFFVFEMTVRLLWDDWELTKIDCVMTSWYKFILRLFNWW